MKILKYGEGYPKTITCSHCKSELEYDACDVYRFTDHFIEESKTTEYVKCPVCNKAVTTQIYSIQHSNQEKKRWWEI